MLISVQLSSASGRPNAKAKPRHATHILHEQASQHHWHGEGALSIKCFFRGRALYDVGVGRYSVDDTSYLILNDLRTYSIEIDSQNEVESFCIFFEHGFAEEVRRSLSGGTALLLEEPEPACAALNFFERTYPHDQILSPALFYLRAHLRKGRAEPVWLCEQLHEIMERLLLVHAQIQKQVDEIPALRAGNREELYRRLYRARDYASACLEQPITLSDMARTACLSTNHFLRTFKQAFHQTPHQYLMRLRLDRAQTLLRQTDQRVTDICFAVGFESLGSFSWLFRQRVGLTPEAYRNAKR